MCDELIQNALILIVNNCWHLWNSDFHRFGEKVTKSSLSPSVVASRHKSIVIR